MKIEGNPYQKIESLPISIGDINESIQRYNGFLFTQKMDESFKDEEDEDDSDDRPAYIKESEFERSLSNQTKDLKDIGLIYEKRDSDKYSAPYVCLTLQDGGKFINYLDKLKNTKISEKDKEGLMVFLAQTELNLRSSYTLESETDVDAILELRESLEEIIKRIDDLTGDKENEEKKVFKHISDFIIPLKQGWFQEYALLKDQYVFNENFGPDKWHGDSSVERYKQKWQEVIDIVKELKNKPHLPDTINEIKKYLTESLEKALVDVVELERTEKNQKFKQHWTDLMPVIENIYKKVQSEI